MKYIALLLCLSIALSLKGQQNQINYEVSGLIIEKLSGRCVPYATIILKNDSINEKKMQACDALGRFTINLSTPQTYILTVTAVGFKEFNRTIEVSESKTDLGRLAMEEGTEIKEITITAQKPLVKIEVDKIIYSMESDPEAQTNNTLEMLSRVPLITVDAEENITLNGQSNFKILINGKSSSMMSGNLTCPRLADSAPTATRPIAAAANVTTSSGGTPNSRLSIAFANSAAPTTPITTPATATRSAPNTTRRNVSRAPAPSAIRMPISDVRRATE